MRPNAPREISTTTSSARGRRCGGDARARAIAAPDVDVTGRSTVVVLSAPSKALEPENESLEAKTTRAKNSVIALCARAGVRASHVATSASGAAMACGATELASVEHSSGVTRDASARWIVCADGVDASDVIRELDSVCESVEAGSARVRAVGGALRALAKRASRPFAVVAFDNESRRGLAVRHHRASCVRYGHDENGALVLTIGGTFDDAALDLEELSPGRFVFGHGYVKPMEFGEFWSSARANRAGSPAKSATKCYEPIPRSPLAPKKVQGEVARLAPASADAYAPPAVRAARKAAEERARLEAEVESRRNSEAVDREIAISLQNQERLASALGGALTSALMSAVSRASLSTEQSLLEVSRFHAARAGRQNVEAVSSFYSPAPSDERKSFDTCARVSIDSRRGSVDSRLDRRRAAA